MCYTSGQNLGTTATIFQKIDDVMIMMPYHSQPCHIIHNTAHKGWAGFTCSTKFDVEDFCIDVFYYFDKSTKRKNALQGYAEFCDQEYCDILKHINVRWLSLERVVERILLQYSSLRGYFLGENAPKSATNCNGIESEWDAAKRFKR